MEGVFLGVVVAIPSGFVFLLLMRTVMRVRRGEGTDKEMRWLVAQFLGLPTFILGGPWFATDLVQFFDWERTKFAYTATVGTIFGAVGFVFLIMFAIQTASDMWRGGAQRA